jgi:hypothetical protein
MAQANRVFMQRAVRFLAAEARTWQFLDIGNGIPSGGNVHEVAGRAAPDNRGRVRGQRSDRPRTRERAVDRQRRHRDRAGRPARPRRHPGPPGLPELIGFPRPVALLLVAIPHFIKDGEDPVGIMGALPDGSYLVASH